MAHETGFSRLFSNRFEKSIYNSIQAWFPKSKVLHNCALTWANGQITEADLVVITRCGFYVLECKDYSGSVTNQDNRWRHIIEHEGRPDFDKRFNDPFYQNNNHIRCLRKLLKLEERIPVFSMVVFSDKTNIEAVSYDYPLRTVVQGKSGVVEMIGRIEASHKHVMTKVLVEEYSQLLAGYEPKTEEQRLENVRRIRGRRAIKKGTDCQSPVNLSFAVSLH